MNIRNFICGSVIAAIAVFSFGYSLALFLDGQIAHLAMEIKYTCFVASATIFAFWYWGKMRQWQKEGTLPEDLS